MLCDARGDRVGEGRVENDDFRNLGLDIGTTAEPSILCLNWYKATLVKRVSASAVSSCIIVLCPLLALYADISLRHIS